MEFEISYLYPFTYVPFRCQNPRDGVGRAWTTVSIQEISDHDAPVVMTVANIPSDKGKPDYAKGYERFLPTHDGSPRRVRMRHGQFYVEGFPEEEFERRSKDGATLNETFLAVGVPGKRKPGLTDHEHRSDPVTTYSYINRSSGGMREGMTHDDRGRKMGEHIARQASHMFVVDGVTYELCREPVLAISFHEDKEPVVGVVEAFSSPAERLHNKSTYSIDGGIVWTSSLGHAPHLIKELGITAPQVSFAVLDGNASYYDGVASDILYLADRAARYLEKTLHATSVGTLHAYHRLADAVRDIDPNTPSLSEGVVEAAEGIIRIVSDPEIDDPMRELSHSSYMTAPSHVYHAPLNLDNGTRFGLGLDYVSHFRDGAKQLDVARERAESISRRWNLRHPESTLDNGHTTRLASRPEKNVTVSEIGSREQARHACRAMGVSFSDTEEAILAGERAFIVSTRSEIAAVVCVPCDGHWHVISGTHPLAERALEIVGSHIDNMAELDHENVQEQQIISIF